MILHDAFLSLKNDFLHSFFYWLTFVISSMFIFLFLVVSMSDSVGVTFIEAKSDIATTLAVASAALCMIEIWFANDFFIKNKSKELAVRAVCGATYVQLALYLLIQTVFLLICAIPIGIVLGICLIPAVNTLINSLTASAMVIGISSEAILVTVIILGFIVFWTLILNLSFAYRNNACQLLNAETMRTGSSNPFATSFLNDIPFLNDMKKGKEQMLAYLKTGLDIAMFAVPILVFYYSPQGTVYFAMVSLYGLNKLVKNFALPFLNGYIQKNISNPEKVGYLGFVRHDMKVLKINVLLLIVTTVLLISVLVGTVSALDTVLVLVCYVAMSTLLSMAIMFRFSSDLSFRKKYFKTLTHIGYMEKDEKKIITKEVVSFYLTVAVLILVYLINISAALCFSGALNVTQAVILVTGALIPELICMLINLRFYMNVIFEKKKGVK